MADRVDSSDYHTIHIPIKQPEIYQKLLFGCLVAVKNSFLTSAPALASFPDSSKFHEG
jgi:hypothetical protein